MASTAIAITMAVPTITMIIWPSVVPKNQRIDPVIDSNFAHTEALG